MSDIYCKCCGELLKYCRKHGFYHHFITFTSDCIENKCFNEIGEKVDVTMVRASLVFTVELDYEFGIPKVTLRQLSDETNLVLETIKDRLLSQDSTSYICDISISDILEQYNEAIQDLSIDKVEIKIDDRYVNVKKLLEG